MKRLALLAAALLALVPVTATASNERPLGGDLAKAARARDAIVELDVKAGREILKGADPRDAALAIERARLAIYEGDYDEAARILNRAELVATQEGAELVEIARGCARSMAGAVFVNDDERGVIVRLQDDDDRALAPLLAEVAVKVREQLIKDLGVELPKPLHVDLVRDQFSLAAMTGLPEQAARTTGTVAVAKWGRVTMISPRATSQGYPWLDTLAHEMTHLALSRGTRDKAPLWLQEGVAKREETRWRIEEPGDDVPPIDAVAAVGIEKGLGRSLDQLGPSIAMLPTAEQAQVAFAEVQSFVRYYIKERGDDALPDLVRRIRDGSGDGLVEAAVKDASGLGFKEWDKKWRAAIAAEPHDLPPDLAPASEMPKIREVGRKLRLGQLLHDRGRDKAAVIEHDKAHVMMPFDASVRAFLGEALAASGERDKAAALVAKPEDVHGKFGRWWSLHAMFLDDEAEAKRGFSIGISLDPLDPNVGCAEETPPSLPKDPLVAAICEAARRVPVGD
jgi:tetratricopeptide (TPR) repeat protein